MTSIAIVDYGMGNYHSVERALRHAAPEADIQLCRKAAEIDAADRVVFPGQGAMADCIRTLDEAGLRDAVMRAVNNKPLLGVCVGEQMLFERSEEGNTESLGVFKGVVRRFHGPAFEANADVNGGGRLKVPHMGWNPVRHTREHALWTGILMVHRFISFTVTMLSRMIPRSRLAPLTMAAHLPVLLPLKISLPSSFIPRKVQTMVCVFIAIL